MSREAFSVPRAVIVRKHDEVEGDFILETDCADFEAFKRLPAAVTFDGRTYGKTGWNSDSGYACFKTGVNIAIAKRIQGE